MKIEELSLAEIVTAKPQAAPVLEAFHLDYCCKGKQKLSEAVSDPEKLSSIVGVLELLYSENTNNAVDFNQIPLGDLVDHILNVHHKYVKENIPVIRHHLDKVVIKHGEKFPHMIEIRSLFNKVINDLTNHMMKEELILFPRIKTMVNNINEGDAIIAISIEHPIRVMEKEHEFAGDLMAEIRNLSNNYTPVEGACMTHRLCLEELRIFEEDLHQHVHLENNILFPKAIEKEKLSVNQKK